MPENLEKKRGLLLDAVDELTLKIKGLRMEKEELEEQVDRLVKDMGDTQAHETRLRDKISKLIDKESRLTQQKTEIHEKITTVQEKILKISKMAAELKEIGTDEGSPSPKESPDSEESFLDKVKKKFSSSGQ